MRWSDVEYGGGTVEGVISVEYVCNARNMVTPFQMSGTIIVISTTLR